MGTKSVKRRDGYEVSRVMYILEALFEYFISILTTGVYLAKLTTTIGISDSMTAILSTVTSLSSMFQIVSIYLAHKTPVKRWIIPMQLLTQIIFASLYLIPILGFEKNASWIFFFVIIIANALKSIVSPSKINWFLTLVDSKKRGSYTSILTMISVIGGTVFTLVAGSIVDSFESAGNMNGAFITLTVMILVLVVLCNIPLFISKEKPEDIEKRESPLQSVSSLFKNSKYRRVIFIFTLQGFASGITSPFLGTYQINELGFSMTFIAIADIIVNIVWISALAIYGRLSYRYSHQSILRVDYVICVFIFAVLIFTTPANGMIMFTLYRILGAIHNGATAVSQRNLIFEISPPEERTSALAIFTIFSGLFGFIATLAATPFVNYVQANGGIQLFGVNLYAQQMLAAASCTLFIIVSILWNVSYKKLYNK